MRRFIIFSSILVAGAASADALQPDADVFFDSDESALDAGSVARLDDLAARADDIPGTRFVLDAYTDTRGSAPYNIGLAIRRAESVKNFLTMQGIDADRIVIAVYGEEGNRRGSAKLDRRVSITLTAEPLYSIIDRSGPDVTAVLWDEPVTLAEIEGPDDKVQRTARR